eukprot:2523711-Rhodomonas_salina.1
MNATWGEMILDYVQFQGGWERLIDTLPELFLIALGPFALNEVNNARRRARQLRRYGDAPEFAVAPLRNLILNEMNYRVEQKRKIHEWYKKEQEKQQENPIVAEAAAQYNMQ